MADLITARDSLSYKVLTELGIKSTFLQGFDLSALLEVPHKEKSNLGYDTKILGISILPFFEIYYNDKQKDILFINKIAEGLNRWLSCHERSLIYLFVFKGKSNDDDVLMTERLMELIKKKERVLIVPYNPNPLETLAKVGECHAFIGMRYHSCMFAYLNGLPLLIINYAEKNESLKIDVGLPDHSIISLDEILEGKFECFLDKLYEDPDKFIATMSPELAKLKSWPADLGL